jgi:ribosomal protein S1
MARPSYWEIVQASCENGYETFEVYEVWSGKVADTLQYAAAVELRDGLNALEHEKNVTRERRWEARRRDAGTNA